MEIKGGDKLTAALNHIASQVTKAATLEIGFMADATYPDGTSVALVATLNEFGVPSRGQPPRPFFRSMIAEKSGEWPAAVGDLLVANDYDAEKTLSLTGDAIKGQLQQEIATFVGAPLAESTVKAKGSSKALVDSGHMLNSVDFIVK